MTIAFWTKVSLGLGWLGVAMLVWSMVEWRKRLIDHAMLRSQAIVAVGLMAIGFRVLLPQALGFLGLSAGAICMTAGAVVMQRGKRERRERIERLERLEELEEREAQRIARS